MTAAKIEVCKPNDTRRTRIHLGPEFRTSYGQSHRWIAPVGQNFDIRVDKKQKKSVPLTPEIRFLNEEFYKTDHVRNYPPRACSKNPDQMSKPPVCDTVKFVATFEQKLFRDPPPPILPFRSEMKEAYTAKPLPLNERTVFPPNPYRICEMKAWGRDEQPPLIPEHPGVMKHLDIYLSTSRADYVPYSVLRQRGIAYKDIVTYYDSVGVPRGGKGYGPKKDTKIVAIIKTKQPIYNMKWKKVKNPMQTIPNRGFKTEYKERYQTHTKSELAAYSDLSAVATFPSVTGVSPWQNLSAPAMYCTESCHIGKGYPVNAVIEAKKPQKIYKHVFGCRF